MTMKKVGVNKMQRGSVRVETNLVVRLPIILALTILFLGGGLEWFHRNAPDFVRNGLGGVLIPVAAICSAVRVTDFLLHNRTRKRSGAAQSRCEG